MLKTENDSQRVKLSAITSGLTVLDITDNSIHIDDWISFDVMAEIVDYLRSLDKKDELFEKCWVAYRRKGSKKKAKEYWNKLSGKEKNSVLDHINAYVSSREVSYQKDFERYLRDKTFSTVVFQNNMVLYDPTGETDMKNAREEILLKRFYETLGDDEASIYGIDTYQWHMMTERQKNWHRNQPDKQAKMIAWIRERDG